MPSSHTHKKERKTFFSLLLLFFFFFFPFHVTRVSFTIKTLRAQVDKRLGVSPGQVFHISFSSFFFYPAALDEQKERERGGTSGRPWKEIRTFKGSFFFFSFSQFLGVDVVCVDLAPAETRGHEPFRHSLRTLSVTDQKSRGNQKEKLGKQLRKKMGGGGSAVIIIPDTFQVRKKQN